MSFWNLFLQLLVSLGIMALFKWAKNLRDY